jgi:transposase
MASEVARAAGIHVSQLFRWRKDLCDRVDAGPTRLVPVEIVTATVPPAVEAPASSAFSSRRRRKSGIIEIELGGGRRVRVDRDVDVEALRRVLDTLGSR